MKYPTLANLGNTCCINTLLQSIYNSDLYTVLDSIKLREGKHDMCIALKKLLYNMKNDTSDVTIPREFIKTLVRKLSNWISIGDQMDINEVWTLLVDLIEEELKTKQSNKLSFKRRSVIDDETYAFYKKAETEWFTKACLSEWSNSTKWMIVSIVKCSVCKHTCQNFETCSMLTISLDNNKDNNKDNDKDNTYNLEHYIDKYFQSETLDEWKCDNCKNTNCGTRTMRIWRAPKILAIALKRTIINPNNTITKINTSIDINQTININKWLIHPVITKTAYNLNSISLHNGNTTGGHYRNVSFDESANVWRVIDDDSCHVFNESENDKLLLNNNTGCMFFYKVC